MNAQSWVWLPEGGRTAGALQAAEKAHEAAASVRRDRQGLKPILYFGGICGPTEVGPSYKTSKYPAPIEFFRRLFWGNKGDSPGERYGLWAEGNDWFRIGGYPLQT